MPLFVGASESYDTDAWEAYNLKKENAKLRELVRDVLRFVTYSPRPRTTDESVRMAHELYELEVRAHELKIEVDQ